MVKIKSRIISAALAGCMLLSGCEAEDAAENREPLTEETTASAAETSTVSVEPSTTVSESEPLTWETDKHDGEPNPGMPARATNDLMYGGEEYYLFIDIAPFIYGEDGKCCLLGDGYKTVQEPGYRIKKNLSVDETLTALLRDREPVGTLTYTDGALNADFEVALKEFDGADLYENGNPKDDYGLTLVSTEPLCYVDGTPVYLTADASKDVSETTTTAEATVPAPERPSAKDYDYGEADGRVTITGYRGKESAVIIPAMIDGKPVIGIGSSAFAQRKVESVVIPEGVISIGSSAFYGNEKLERIVIPESVERIDGGVFDGTRWLAERQAEDPLVIVNNILVDGTACSSESVTIPDGVKKIVHGAFWECETIRSVTIPDSVEEIGDVAFSRCAAPENVILPDHAVKLGSVVFAHTPWFEKKLAEDPLVIVNGNLIDGTTCSGEVTIPDGVQAIAESAFSYSDVKSVTVPDGVTEISAHAFSCCHSLTRVTIPDSVNRIGSLAFSSCTALTNVTIPDGVTEIGYQAFEACVSLTEIRIPDSVTEIGDGVFSSCYALTSVTIPNSVTKIDAAAFCLCKSLAEIVIPDSVTRIDSRAFGKCEALTEVTLPDGLESLDKEAFGDNKMKVAYRGKTYALPEQKNELYEAVNGAE